MSIYRKTHDALAQSFSLVYHQDHANAATHCAPVRYSPITFRLAEVIHASAYDEEYFLGDLADQVMRVIADRGAYEEDPGRSGAAPAGHSIPF